jgi:hypothetical protein
VSGAIQVTAPTLDISGTLTGLNMQMIDTGGLGRSPCQITGGSSLVQVGRGGFAPSARHLRGPGPVAAPAPLAASQLLPENPSLAFARRGCVS